GSLGVLMRTLSPGLLPGNAASAGAATPSSRISATSGAPPTLVTLSLPYRTACPPPPVLLGPGVRSAEVGVLVRDSAVFAASLRLGGCWLIRDGSHGGRGKHR